MKAWLTMVVVVVLAGEARADLYSCRKGKETFVTNYKVPGAHCTRLDIQTDPPVKADSAASDGGVVTVHQGADAFDKPKVRREKFAPIGAPDQKFSGDEPDDRSAREALYAAYFDEAAELYELPEAFLRAVARVESNFRYRAKSGAGAMGLMQLMPGTARDMGVSDVWDPRSNVLGGGRLLRVLADRFDGDMVKVLAAYHAGGGAVADADGIPYEATESYVRSVLDYYYQYKQVQGIEQ